MGQIVRDAGETLLGPATQDHVAARAGVNDRNALTRPDACLGQQAIHRALFLDARRHRHGREIGDGRHAERLEQRVEPIHHVKILPVRHGIGERRVASGPWGPKTDTARDEEQ